MIIDVPEVPAMARVDPEISGNGLNGSHQWRDTDIEWAKNWSTQFARLADLRKLRNNWDGDGAHAPSAQLLDSLEHLLRRLHAAKLAAPSRMIATVDGTVAAEWQSHSIYASVEINQPYQEEWLVERTGYRPEFRIENWAAARISPRIPSGCGSYAPSHRPAWFSAVTATSWTQINVLHI